MEIQTPDLQTVKTHSSPLTRRERGISTRQRLAVAAIQLGAKHGFSNVPLRAVVEKADCHNISAVHYHYKSREGLLTALVEAIDAAWPADLPPAAFGNVRTTLAYFLLNLDTLKQADAQWHDDVVRFLTRLCSEEGAGLQKAVAALLAPRLRSVFEFVHTLCPAVPADELRLRVSNACLLLMTTSTNLNQCYMKALECEGARGDGAEYFSRAVDMAARIICSDPLPMSEEASEIRIDFLQQTDPQPCN